MELGQGMPQCRENRARGTLSGRELHPEGFPSVSKVPRRKHLRSLWGSSWEGRGHAGLHQVRAKLQRRHTRLLVHAQNRAVKSGRDARL